MNIFISITKTPTCCTIVNCIHDSTCYRCDDNALKHCRDCTDIFLAKDVRGGVCNTCIEKKREARRRDKSIITHMMEKSPFCGESHRFLCGHIETYLDGISHRMSSDLEDVTCPKCRDARMAEINEAITKMTPKCTPHDINIFVFGGL